MLLVAKGLGQAVSGHGLRADPTNVQRSFLNAFPQPVLMNINMFKLCRNTRLSFGAYSCSYLVVRSQVETMSRVEAKLLEKIVATSEPACRRGSGLVAQLQ